MNIVIPILMYISTKNIENALNFNVKMEKIVYNVIFRSNILVRFVVPTVNIGATKSHQSHLCLRPCIASQIARLKNNAAL